MFRLLPAWIVFPLFLAVLWDLAWRGLALWRSARRGEAVWFVLLLVVNTLGLLPIGYLLYDRYGRPTAPSTGDTAA